MRQMPKVLIIDDEEDIRSVLKDMLDMSGYEVDTAENGRQAKDLYDKTEHRQPFRRFFDFLEAA